MPQNDSCKSKKDENITFLFTRHVERIFFSHTKFHEFYKISEICFFLILISKGIYP